MFFLKGGSLHADHGVLTAMKETEGGHGLTGPLRRGRE